MTRKKKSLKQQQQQQRRKRHTILWNPTNRHRNIMPISFYLYGIMYGLKTVWIPCVFFFCFLSSLVVFLGFRRFVRALKVQLCCAAFPFWALARTLFSSLFFVCRIARQSWFSNNYSCRRIHYGISVDFRSECVILTYCVVSIIHFIYI